MNKQASIPAGGILISDILNKAEAMPAAPGLVGEVLTLTADPDFSMDKLVSLVRMDTAITVHVLRMCNSSYYGLRYKVASLDHALAALGVNALVDIVLSSGLLRLFGNMPQDGYMLGKGQLWRHSVATGLIAQKLVVKLQHLALNPSVTFTAALLHDAGKLVLNQFVIQHFYEMESLMHEHGYSLMGAEKQILGIDHASLGGIMMEKWAFPEEIISSVSYHHLPHASVRHGHLVKLVALANLLAICAEYGREGMGYCGDVSIASLLESLGLNPDDEEPLLQEAMDWLKPAAGMLTMLTQS